MQNDWRFYDLLLQVKLMRQKDLYVASYSSQLKAIWREIDQLWPVLVQNTEYWKRENKVRTLTFLMGLNSDYESFRAQLIHREKFPTLEEAVSEATSADYRKQIKTADPSTSVSVVHVAKKKEVKEKVSPKFASKDPSSSRSDHEVCAYCTKPGHHIKECRKLAWKEDMKKGLWNPGAKKKAYVATSVNQEGEATKAEGSNDIHKLISEEMKKMFKKFSSSSFAQSGQYKHMSIAFTTYENLHLESCPWIIDSGPTDHMSPNDTLFEDYRVLNDSHLVFTANGGILKVAGVGNIQIKGVLLRRTLHVPGLKTKLLSIQRLIDDIGWRFLLDSSQCVLCVKETGERILSARRKGGLLLLDGGVDKETQGRVLHTQSKENVVLLHRRLGHPSFHLLKQVYPNLFKHLDI